MTQAMTFDKVAMSHSHSLGRGVMVAALAAGVWALSAVASQAHAASDVYWSVGVQSPGVQFGVTNAQPVYVQRPQRVYVQPAPVVVYPGYRHVRPVVVAPAPIYGHGYAPVYIGNWNNRWDDRWDRRHNKWRDHRNHGNHGHR